MKKAEMSIEFTFLIVLAIIVLFVVITMIANFALKGEGLFCKLTGNCGPEDSFIPDNQLINLSKRDCGTVRTEIEKHSKLCYTILSPGACTFTPSEISIALSAFNINATMTANPADQDFDIFYLRETRRVTII